MLRPFLGLVRSPQAAQIARAAFGAARSAARGGRSIASGMVRRTAGSRAARVVGGAVATRPSVAPALFAGKTARAAAHRGRGVARAARGGAEPTIAELQDQASRQLGVVAGRSDGLFGRIHGDGGKAEGMRIALRRANFGPGPERGGYTERLVADLKRAAGRLVHGPAGQSHGRAAQVSSLADELYAKARILHGQLSVAERLRIVTAEEAAALRV